MRLLQYNGDGNFSLTEFLGSDIPKYAILSHTWEAEEVTFNDLVDGTGEDKAGYEKIRFCGEQAGRDHIQYFWVDTCCIDKTNNTGLAEAINSMFRWYCDAAKCYVYLSDVPGSTPNIENNSHLLPWESAFRKSKWFTRGWTLQELLAPSSVEFFSRHGKPLGDKQNLKGQIHEITGIPISALEKAPLSEFGIDERLSWAEHRQTTRAEDKAYSLLGIFGIYLSPIYGEGTEHAFARLRRKILKSVTDEQHLNIPTANSSENNFDDLSHSTLILVVSTGDWNAVRNFLSKGGPLTPRSPDGQTALHVCIGYNDRGIAELLLNHNLGTINITNMDGLTPIQLAMWKQSWSLASLLIERGCSIRMEDFSTMLFEAVRQHTGDFSSIRPVIHALAKRFNNKPDPISLVHIAIEKANLKCLALFLEGGFDPNIPELETDIFPLQVGVILERVEHVKLLLKHGALLNRDICPNKHHSFKPHHDREYHKSEWFRKNTWQSLLRVSRDFKSNQGPTMFRLLLDNGEDPQFGHAKPNCHLLGMCASNYWVYAEPLIKAGTDVRARNGRGYTAMYWAANCNNVRMINLLLDKGADINVKTEPNIGGHTPLHAAAMFNRPDVARVLIKRGADIRLTDAKGLTSLQLAERQGNSHKGIMNMMKKAIEERNTL